MIWHSKKILPKLFVKWPVQCLETLIYLSQWEYCLIRKWFQHSVHFELPIIWIHVCHRSIYKFIKKSKADFLWLKCEELKNYLKKCVVSTQSIQCVLSIRRQRNTCSATDCESKETKRQKPITSIDRLLVFVWFCLVPKHSMNLFIRNHIERIHLCQSLWQSDVLYNVHSKFKTRCIQWHSMPFNDSSLSLI